MSALSGLKTSIGNIGGGQEGGAEKYEFIQKFILQNSQLNFICQFNQPIDFTKYRFVEFFVFGRMMNHKTSAYLEIKLNDSISSNYSNNWHAVIGGTASSGVRNGTIYWYANTTATFLPNSELQIKGIIWKNHLSNLICIDCEFSSMNQGFGKITGKHLTETTISKIAFHMNGGDPPNQLANSEAYFYGWKYD